MPTGEEIERDEMKRWATMWADAHKNYYNNHCRPMWVQRYDYKFPFDIKALEEYSNMDRSEVWNRYHRMFETINRLDIPEKEKEEKRAEIVPAFNRDTDHASLNECSQQILYWLNRKPLEMIEALNTALEVVVHREDDMGKEDYYPPVFEILNWPETKIDKIEYEDLGKLKAITGWIASIENPPHIEYTDVAYKCPACGHVTHGAAKPKACEECGYDKEKNLIFIPEESDGHRVQQIVMMENYDEMEPENTPSLLSCYVSGNEINKYTVGDRVNIVGTIGVVRKKEGSYLILRALYALKHEENINISKPEMDKIEAIAKDPFTFIHQNLGKSIIGTEYDIIKESLALTIAGGSESKKRANIHMLLIGNPGIGKSELLYSAKEDAPKGFFVSRTSGAGLTAAVSDVQGSPVLVPGMLVLANRGTLMIDEIDKIDKRELGALHAAMEQGKFTESMAGIKREFITNTSIIAAANPIGSIFDENRTILEQISLPESLLQRFDIIWVMRGEGHVDALKILRSTEDPEDPILKKYFYYCSGFNPSTTKVEEEIAKFFEDIRSKSGDLSIAPRMLMGMKRLTQASAKLHLREEATLDDVMEMEKIVIEYLKPFGFSIQNILMPSSLKDRIWRILDLFKEKRIWDKRELIEQTAFSEQDLDKCIDIMKRDGKIFEPRNNRYEVA